MEELVTSTGPIRSNQGKYCARCNSLISKNNDSGWEVFVSGNVTQPICSYCHQNEDVNFSGEKSTITRTY